MRQEFNEQIVNLKKKVFTKIKPKIFKGEPVNGSSFLALCKLLCELINNGGLLSIENSWSAVCRNECQKILNGFINLYSQCQYFKKSLEKNMKSYVEMK